MLHIIALNKKHNSIKFVPSDDALVTKAQQALLAKANQYVAVARELTFLADEKNLTPSGQTIHQAIDAFAGHMRENLVTKVDTTTRITSEWGYAFAGNVLRLKDSIVDIPLAEFGFDGIGKAAAYWRSRPPRKGT